MRAVSVHFAPVQNCVTCGIMLHVLDLTILVKQNQQFQYLGSWVTSDGKSDKEIRHRIGMAKTAYRKMERILASHSIKFATKLCLLCVVSTAVWIGKLDNQQGHAGTTSSG